MATCYSGGMRDLQTWSGRWDRWFPLAFFWSTGAAAAAAALHVTGWTFDPGALVFIAVPIMAATWAVLLFVLFLPLTLDAVLVGAALDAAQCLARAVTSRAAGGRRRPRSP